MIAYSINTVQFFLYYLNHYSDTLGKEGLLFDEYFCNIFVWKVHIIVIKEDKKKKC